MDDLRRELIDLVGPLDPVDPNTLPMADGVEAQHLLNAVTAAPPRTVGRRWVWRIAVAAGALAVAAAALALTRDVTDPITIACYSAPSLDGDVAAVVVGEEGLTVEACHDLWRDQTFTDLSLAEPGAVPPLVACVNDGGNLAVFPSTNDGLCESLGLAPPAEESVERQEPVIDLFDEVYEYVTGDPCLDPEHAGQGVRDILARRGLDSWTVDVGPARADRPCASLAFDAERELVVIVPIPSEG